MATLANPTIVLGIVLNSRNHVLLVRRQGEDKWIFPGGKLEPGEDEAEGVLREIQEETGVQCQTLHSIGRRIHPESKREVSYWLCKPLAESITTKDTKEIAEARWMAIPESLDLLGGTLYEPARQSLLARLE